MTTTKQPIPPWIVQSLIGVLGVAVGGGAGTALAPKAEVTPVTVLEAEARARTHADAAAASALEACRRDLAAAQVTVTAGLARLESKVDRLADDVGTLKVAVAAQGGIARAAALPGGRR